MSYNFRRDARVRTHARKKFWGFALWCREGEKEKVARKRKRATPKFDMAQKIKFRLAADSLNLPLKFQINITMQKNLRAVMALLAKSKRDIEIQSVDFDYLGLCQLATELQKTDRVITLVVGYNLTQSSVENLVSISGDHFNLKFV